MNKKIIVFISVVSITLSLQLPIFSTETTKNQYLTFENASPVIKTLITDIIQDKQVITPQVKEFFWSHFEYAKPLTEEKKQTIQDQLIGPSIILLCYFYNDALIALYLKKPYKSAKRALYEQRLTHLQVLTQLKIKEFDALQDKILEMEKIETEKRGNSEKIHESIRNLTLEFTKSKQKIVPLFTIAESTSNKT